MHVQNMRQRSLPVHNFAMNARAPIQRSSFPVRQKHKTTFSASYLIPIYLEEVMPGDMFNIGAGMACRTSVPIVPILDNWTMDFSFWFCPTRIVWDNWEKMMGAQTNPGDSIAYTVPQVTSPDSGYTPLSLGDYMGLPTVGQVAPGMTVTHSAIPFRMYNKIFNDWYRDQNLIDSYAVPTDNGPDTVTDYSLRKRGKRHDYFTAALPFVQKGDAVTVSLGGSAPVIADESQPYPYFNVAGDTAARIPAGAAGFSAMNWNTPVVSSTGDGRARWAPAVASVSTGLLADLTDVSAFTINTLRVAAATQQLLERDARGGTRYVETIFQHWGVRPLDFRLDRPEYLGGGSIPIIINAIPQTSATGISGGSTPAGTLAATGYGQGKTGFSYAATEHGYIFGIASVRAELTYSQGLRRHWSRRTRYDYPYPEFAHLGEQAILNKEIYVRGSASGGLDPADQDMQVFGYIPRYDECRHFPSIITGLFRPSTSGGISYWHSSQLFNSLPTLNQAFIEDNTEAVIARNFSGGLAASGQQFMCDFEFTGRIARPLPTHAVPGLNRF